MHCDGATDEEIVRWQQETIQRCGHVVIGVEATPPWAYTIGLSAGLGHPELLICGREFRDAMRILNGVGAWIRQGHTVHPGQVHVLPPGRFKAVAVPQDRWDDGETFGSWWNHYDAVGGQPAAEAIELVALDGTRRRCQHFAARVPDDVAELLERIRN
jgi:hypothetical protein